jgi:hypothetical protein
MFAGEGLKGILYRMEGDVWAAPGSLPEMPDLGALIPQFEQSVGEVMRSELP